MIEKIFQIWLKFFKIYIFIHFVVAVVCIIFMLINVLLSIFV